MLYEVITLAYRKTFVGMLICVELMLNGAGLSIVAASQLTAANAALGQLAALLVMGLAAAEATLRITSYNVCYTKLLRDCSTFHELVVKSRITSYNVCYTKLLRSSSLLVVLNALRLTRQR